jgi:catalase
MKGRESSKMMSQSSGCPLLHPDASLCAGRLGPTLLQDVHLLDKLQHFDREQLPPRNVHALGVGVHGIFKPSKDASKYSCASLFSMDCKETPVFARFSGVFTGREEAETVRDMRGFALKFYTSEGIWDLLTVNIPVFGVRDAKAGPDAIHAFKRDIRTGEWNTDTVWDFTVNHPEALHQTLLLLSDQYGTPNSYRNMNGAACNTFSMINKEGERHWVRFHLCSDLPSSGLDAFQAKMVAGEDPDFLRRDLKCAIERGDFPKWKLCIQVMKEEDGLKEGDWVFDATRYWCKKTYPPIELGTIELNRMPEDHYAQTEQVAFSPSNVIPGISFSPDRLLQGRLFIYPDTQYHRLGPNYKMIPINMPKNEFKTPYIGGPHRQLDATFPHYYPSLMDGLQPLNKIEGNKLPKEMPIRCDDADFFEYDDAKLSHLDQIRETCLKDASRNHLALNIARSLSKVTKKEIVDRAMDMLKKLDEGLANDVQSFCSRVEKADRNVVSEAQSFVCKLQKAMSQDVFQVSD